MTAEKIPLIEKDVQTMSEAIKEIKADMKSHREDMNAHREEFQQFKEELFNKLDQRFAGKWTEKVLVYIGWLILTAVVWAIMTLIIKW